MTDIHGYIRSLTPPLSRDAIYRELVKLDATITRGDITRALKELGYTAKTRKVQGGCGVAHLWIPSRQEPEKEQEQEQKQEQDEPKERTTEDVVNDVEARNATNVELNRRLLETLQISRNLKQEMMEKQVNALVSMARMILAIHGDSYEQQRYKP